MKITTTNNKSAHKAMDEKFQRYYKSASLRLRLADEIYNTREAKGLSQQALAKYIFSTQKVISRIENGEVNIGIDMFDRLSEELEFTAQNMFRIFNHIELNSKVELNSPVTEFASITINSFVKDSLHTYNVNSLIYAAPKLA